MKVRRGQKQAGIERDRQALHAAGRIDLRKAVL